MNDSHDPVQCVNQLRQTLAADKLSIGFFLGAGCPSAIRLPRGTAEGTDPLIPDITGITKIVVDTMGGSSTHQDAFARLIAILAEDGEPSPNVEMILTRIRELHSAAGNSEVRGLDAMSLRELDRAICATISERATRDLPTATTPYHSLARLARSYRVPPLEVFTTNYDLLVEQAFEALQVPFFDGFIGSSRPFFDQRAIDDDQSTDSRQRLPERWCRLWKLHGSINWRFDAEDRSIVRSREPRDGDELLIHPSNRKHDESRRRPYFVMLDRLKSFIRNRRQPVAVFVLGYSFSDSHINDTIAESLRSNPSAVCWALQYDDLSRYPEAIEIARHESNFALFAHDAAVTRRYEGKWIAKPGTESAALGGAFEFADPAADGSGGQDAKNAIASNANDAPRDCRFLLGDFASFGEFLEEFSRPSLGGQGQ